MEYKFYVADNGLPFTDSTCAWFIYLRVSNGQDLIGSAPVITEIGGGWYKFSASPTFDIVGVIDAGAILNDVDRYIPVSIGASDSIFDRVASVFKSLWNKKTLKKHSDAYYTETLYDDDKATVLRVRDIKLVGDIETRDEP